MSCRQRGKADRLVQREHGEALRDLRRRQEIRIAQLVRVDRAGAGPTMVTVDPEMVHTPGVAKASKLIDKPELADAETANGASP
jgi:hypothetical protein